jgi:hypothetical protein
MLQIAGLLIGVGLCVLTGSIIVFGFTPDKQLLRNGGVFAVVFGLILLVRTLSKKPM